MSAGETRLRVAEETYVVPVPNEHGDKALEAELVFQNIMLLPVGPNQVAGIPIHVYRIALTKKGLKALVEQASDVLEDMVDPSNIAIAGNLRDAEGFARQQEGIVGRR